MSVRSNGFLSIKRRRNEREAWRQIVGGHGSVAGARILAMLWCCGRRLAESARLWGWEPVMFPAAGIPANQEQESVGG
jgi:hypothetical protein